MLIEHAPQPERPCVREAVAHEVIAPGAVQRASPLECGTLFRSAGAAAFSWEAAAQPASSTGA